jgi:hypothetical protein
MKILVLGANQRKRFNWGHQLFKDEVARQHNVRFYGGEYDKFDLKRTDIHEILHLLEFKPDLILSYMGKYCKWIKGIRNIDTPKAHIIIDYFPWNYGDEDTYIRDNRVDLLLPVVTHECRALSRNGHYRVRHLPFAVDTNVFHRTPDERDIDVMAVFSVVQWAYPNRKQIIQRVLGMSDLNVLCRASWPKTRIWHDDYVKALARSKIVLNGVDNHRSLNWKFLEPCACGALLMTEAAEDMELMGFKDGVNCVVFNSMAEMEDKIRYYLLHVRERQRIAEAGSILVLGRHNVGTRVSEMTSILQQEFNFENSKCEC